MKDYYQENTVRQRQRMMNWVQCLGSGFALDLHSMSSWIRIRIRIANEDPDPEGEKSAPPHPKKRPGKNMKIT
jgi:hypothetical protein